MPNQPEYVTALQNAANAYMQGLQNREAREQRERERAQEVEQQRQNFLRNFQARQAEAGNVGAARQLDTEFGLTPQVPAGFGALLPKQNQVTNPQALNDAQRKLMGAISSMQGMPAPESPHFYQKHAAFTPDESQALQQGQQAFEQQNLAGLTELSQGKSSPAFQGAFEQFAQQQQAKQQQALEQRQAEIKRTQDEKYFEDQDRLILDGRASPANANKYFQAKRDYLAGKTTELPTLEIREKPDSSGETRLQTARDRKTNTMLMAISRTDNAIATANDDITKEFDRLNQRTQQAKEVGGGLDATVGADFTKRISDLYKKRDQLEKQKESYNKVLSKLMDEEGLSVESKEEPLPTRADDVNRQEAIKVFQRLLALGRDAEYARQESIKWFNFDPMTGQKTPSSYSLPAKTSSPQGIANQALQGTEKIKVDY